jgi:hypothetical protein
MAQFSTLFFSRVTFLCSSSRSQTKEAVPDEDENRYQEWQIGGQRESDVGEVRESPIGCESGGVWQNENQTIVKSSVKIRSGIKSGRLVANENQIMAKSGLKVRSGIKGGRLVGRNKRSSDSE